MSTRAEVKVVEGVGGANGMGSPRVVYLYHHSDGYPSYMVPALKRAYRKFVAAKPDEYGRIPFEVAGDEAHVSRWQGSRANYAATFVIAADLGLEAVEPADEQGNHGDLDYFYEIHVKEGSSKEKNPRAEWDVTIRRNDEHGPVVEGPVPVLSLKSKGG